MQNKDTDKLRNREDDAFYDYFKDNLEEHQLPVDEECWENISQRIKPRKKNVLRRILYSSIAATAAITILFMLMVGNDIDISDEQKFANNIQKTIGDSIENQSLATNVVPDIKIDDVADEVSKQKVAKTIVKKKTEYKSLAITPTAIDRADTSKIKEKPTLDNTYAEVAVEKKETIIDSIPKKRRKGDFDIFFEEHNQVLAYNGPKKNNKWELSASLKASETSSGSLDQPVLTPTYLSSPTDMDVFKSDKTISDAKYAPPLTIGLLVRKRLNNTLSLETGLTYSYLSTTYKDLEKKEYTAKMRLHYIGIPINIVADIWNITPQWKIYASAGAMVEKGLRSDFSQNIYQSNQSIDSNHSIKGIQWSLNASVGVSYRFYQNWNFYLEPHGSYYFDNNQPISIRTEKQTIFGANSGFRYEF